MSSTPNNPHLDVLCEELSVFPVALIKRYYEEYVVPEVKEEPVEPVVSQVVGEVDGSDGEGEEDSEDDEEKLLAAALQMR